MTYKDGYDKIVQQYANYANNINNQYDELKAEIEDKEITDEYTEEMKQDELSLNESNRKEALEDNEDAKKAELDKYDADYKANMDKIQNAKSSIDYDYINTTLENIDFKVPEPTVEDSGEVVEKYMEKLPIIVNNTKYIYLTIESKFEALKQMEEDEYNKYSTEYDAIEAKYNGYIGDINDEYDSMKTVIEDKPITEEYTEEMKQEELTLNESNRQQALIDNQTSKTNEQDALNEVYIETMSKIAIALTEIKYEHETGFSGDVHINGKLHVDKDLNIEGKLNNISIEDLLQKNDLDSILVNKANKEHTHDISDITDYKPYNDTELRNLIKTKPTIYIYQTFEDAKANWYNISPYSLVIIKEGPEPYMNTLIVRGASEHRSMILGMSKVEKDYIWVKFQGDDATPWLKESPWRKIPVLNTSNNLICNNVKADNETRLKALENHKHTIEDITGYEPYDDTELRELIDTKSNNEHTHYINDITGYEPYDDTEIKNMIIDKADIEHEHVLADIMDYEPYDDTELRELIDTKSNNEHTHDIKDIIDYKPYDDTEVRNLIKTKPTIYTYTSMEDMMTDWDNIPDNSIAVSSQGPGNLSATFTYKYNEWRSLSFNVPKLEANYLWTRFQGDNDPWSSPSVWRKIPVLTNDNRLKIDMSGNRNIYNSAVEIYNSSLINGDTIQVKLGKADSSLKSGYFGYLYSDTDPKMSIGFHGQNHILTIGTKIINTALPITASNLKDDNETRLKASETKISNHETRLQTAETKINNHDTTIQTIETTISNHETRLKVVERDSKEHSETLSNHENRLNTIENKIVDKIQNKYKHRLNYDEIWNGSNDPVYYGIEIPTLFDGNIQSCYCHNLRSMSIFQYSETRPRVQIRNQHDEIIKDITDIVYTGPDYAYDWVGNDTDINGLTFYYTSISIDYEYIPLLEGNGDDVFDICIEQINDHLTPKSQFYHTLRLQTTKVECVNVSIPDDNKLLSVSAIRELIYPIGSIYTSMNAINPGSFIGGTWEQIVDRFLYCSNSSLETGGSKKITVEQLPAHSHSITELDIRGNEDGSNQYTIAKYGGNDTTIKTGNTGNGQDYMPEYMTVFAWYRTA